MPKSFGLNPFTGNFDQISEVELAPVGSSPNTDGASIDGDQILTLQPADSTNPGVVTAGAQSFGGDKTFDGEILADGGLDVTATGGTDTLNIGATNADVINIGNSGAQVNLYGTTFYQDVTNLQVADKTITINKDGAAASAFGAGIEIEENAVITAYAQISAGRNSWELKAPTSGIATIEPGPSGIFINQDSHDPLTIGSFGGVSTTTGLEITQQILRLMPADATNPGAVSTTTQSFAGNKTFTGTISASNLSGTNSGDVTLSSFGSAPNANAASLSGQALTLQPASASFPGGVSTTTQSFAGDKTFGGALTVTGTTTLNTGLTGPLKAASGVVSSSAIDLSTSEVTGTLPETKGGTNQSTYTTGDILYASGSNTLSKLPVGSAGQLLRITAGVPYWNDASNATINYIGNPGADSSLYSTTGWATFADAAQSTPTDGTGGSPNITLTRDTGTPIRGAASFLITKGAANRQGEGVSSDFTIANADKAQVLEISFDYNPGTNWVASSGAVSSDSDIEVFLYDITNAALIPVQPKVLTSGVGYAAKFQGSFQTAVNSSSYRLILFIPTTNASAWTFKFDNVRVGPPVMTQGTPVTDWRSTSITWINVPGTSVSYYRRNGDTIQVRSTLTLTGAATGTIRIPTVSGTSVDTSKASSTSNVAIFGYATGGNTPAANYTGSVQATATANEFRIVGPGGINEWAAAVPLTWANGNTISVEYSYPVVGWSSQVEMSSEADTRVVAMHAAATPTGTLNSSYNTTIIGTAINDTHAAYNTSTGVYTIPVSGYYKVAARVYVSASYSAGNVLSVRIRKNGTSLAAGPIRATGTSSTVMSADVSTLVLCNAGDTLDIQTVVDGGTPTYSGADAANYFDIMRLSGPAAIAANEKVYAKYQISASTANSSLANDTNEIIDFDTKVYDSHNAVTTGVSWKFTAPKSAVYSIKATSRLEAGGGWAAGELTTLRLFKNNGGSPDTDFNSIIMQATHSSAVNINGASDIFLNAGDYIDIRQYQNSGGPLNFNTSGVIVNVSITSQE